MSADASSAGTRRLKEYYNARIIGESNSYCFIASRLNGIKPISALLSVMKLSFCDLAESLLNKPISALRSVMKFSFCDLSALW